LRGQDQLILADFDVDVLTYAEIGLIEQWPLRRTNGTWGLGL
jgi:hypothetical protein